MQRVLQEKDAITAACRETMEDLDTVELDAEVARLENEVSSIAERLRKMVEENARVLRDQEEYQREYDVLAAEYERISEEIRRTETQIKERTDHRRRIEVFLWMLMEREECESFDPYTFVTMVEKVVVDRDRKLEICFRNGIKHSNLDYPLLPGKMYQC